MKTLKVIGNCCLVFLAVISVCVSLAFGYYHFFNKDTTIGVNNINNQLAVDVKKKEEMTVEEALKLAEENKLDYIVFTDHDAVSAFGEVKELNLKEHFSGKVIPGCELRFVYNNMQMEVLGFEVRVKGHNPTQSSVYGNIQKVTNHQIQFLPLRL